MKQVIQTKTTSNYKHETLIKLGGYVEEHLVIICQLQGFVFYIKYCSRLLLIEEFPDFKDTFQMLPSYFMELSLKSSEFLPVLLFQNLEIKVQEPLDFRSVLCAETIDVVK